MTSPKASRSAPPKFLDNYVATISRLPKKNELKIDNDSSFLPMNYISDGTNSSPGLKTNVPLGFSLNLNGITYRSVLISGYGWMALNDPETTPSVFYYTTSPFENGAISSPLARNGILIAPWWDTCLTPVKKASALSSVPGYSTLTDPDVLREIESGIIRKYPLSYLDYSARYKQSYDRLNGRSFVVRWTTFRANTPTVSPSIPYLKFKFEVAIFENGKIEIRYWPLDFYEVPISSALTARAQVTAGIFWRSSLFPNEFRDFAPIFGWENYRTLSPLGGAKYTPGYTSFDGTNTQNYAINMGAEYWPGPAVVTFAPPVNSIKFLPRKIASDIGNSRSLVSRSGMFDDRRTLCYTTGSRELVSMPSTLTNRLLGDTSPAIDMGIRQQLFPTGGIVMEGRQDRDAAESMISQVTIAENTSNRSDRSFNESQKIYDQSEFYASGSTAWDQKTVSLRSKTQFTLSIPVENTSRMSSISSSFYYFNKERKQWQCYSLQPNYIPPCFIDYNGRPETKEELGYDTSITVTETSIGFDSVGRKICSGTNVFDTSLTMTSGARKWYQSSDTIGSTYNYTGELRPDSSRRQSDALSQKYENSITDSQDFYPSQDCLFKINTDKPFLLEKIVVNIPLFITGNWFQDVTTCARPISVSPTNVDGELNYMGDAMGPIDLGGPGITFAIHCPRKTGRTTFLDLIASGTITHNFDNTADVILKKDTGMQQYTFRPWGFKAFGGKPTAVIEGTLSGSEYIFDGRAKLEMQSSVSSGVIYSRHYRSFMNLDSNYVQANKDLAIGLLNKEFLDFNITTGSNADAYTRTGDIYWTGTAALYRSKSPRGYIHQISPLSRGTTKFSFSGNSVLGGVIGQPLGTDKKFINPFYVTGSRRTELESIINSDSNFTFDGVMMHSTVKTIDSPYLLFPGDSIALSISKTRPILSAAFYLEGFNSVGEEVFPFSSYSLSGSHGTVLLNTGTIDITFYGSYIKGGEEYQP